ncbi:type VI secretion system tip protein VgrG [Variovorax beijingensis]|uniref:Type VI secretion system tip protein VgrG n=1 Tax=Variovorax beijingensis TaxID=2496117 RepID=A0A3P3EWC1_9BURK|nr:type VI secretion system tip protein TssI/VgrG [Variovorax beijingensis]RRH90730.1 type VI secretion system tip protein VgrG [Variovorax beijingensis]RSZ31290.1 type VI secretion system tip protein VgrG [Variovorax beijingensis]
MPRTVQVHTALNAEQLKFRAMRGQEGLSQLFEFEVDMVSPSFSLDLKKLLGTSLTLELQDEGASRFLNGTVVRFELVGRANETGRHYIYRALVQPWLWYLTRTTDCRIFQNKSVPDVLEEVLGKYGFEYEKRLTGSYRPWEYCVQYQESDFAFVCRLMEHEGIAYHFEHRNGSHLLVLADDVGGYSTLPGHATIAYRPRDRVVNAMEPCIDQWRISEQITSGRVMLDDFDFRKSRASLQSVQQDPKSHDHSSYEVYEWLGGYSENDQGDSYAKIRLQELQCAHELATGHTNVAGMAPGYLFQMTHCPREADNREYLVTQTRYDLQEPEYSTGGTAESVCEFDFTVLPSSVPYRPARKTPKPRTNGPQTATVVGPEEIWTDRFGRVKLQFRWDRYGQSDENSSCWVRVSSNWAGANYGTMHMPRVGQEVIVDFIGGEPDRPIITGRVYNNDQMPPWELPANATASGILTRSSSGGAANQANMLRFEDRTGAEQILLHAERNLDVEVEADETHTTGGTRTTLVKGHESATYQSGETRDITAGAKETIAGGDTRDVTGGFSETVSGGVTQTISGGKKRTLSGGLNDTITGGVQLAITGGFHGTIDGQEIRFVSGGRNDTIDTSNTVLVNGPSNTTVTGPTVHTSPDVTFNTTNHIHNTTQHVINTNVYNTTSNTYNNLTVNYTNNSATYTNNYSKSSDWRWFRLGGTGLNMDVSGISLGVVAVRSMAIGVQAQAIGVKLEAVGAEWKNKAMSLGDAGALIQLVGTEIKTGGLRAGIQALKILL